MELVRTLRSARAGIYLIEDCAHSLGSEWEGNLVGHHREIACFSTQSYKLLNSGEGGLIATNTEELAVHCIITSGSYEKLYKKHLARPLDDNSYGFKNLEGLDINLNSLDLLKKQGIYNALYLEELGNTLSFADNTFDAVVLTGVFTRNQVPLESFEELIRILKPGGIFAVVLRTEDNDLYYKPIKKYCAMKMWQEVFKQRISVLKSCNHELVILRK